MRFARVSAVRMGRFLEALLEAPRPWFFRVEISLHR